MTDILRQDNPDVARFIGSYKYDQEITDRRNKFGGGTSLPLDSDDYEGRQRKLKDELRRDFLDQQEKKKNVELQRVEARRNRPPPQATHPPAGQVDYDQQNQMARTEDRRAYQDHMGKYHQLNVVQVKPPINYEADRKRLSEERKQDYDQMIEKKAKEERYWKMRGRPVTPQGGGLDIGHYDRHLKQQAPLKKKEYKEYLEQQQKEHMYARARQEPEMPVLDRSAPQHGGYVTSKPPPGPHEEDERQRRQEEARQQRGTPAQPMKDHYYSSDEYEKFQRNLHRQEGEEYREFLKKKKQEVRNRDWQFGNSGALELKGDDENQSKKAVLREERQKDYNEFMSQQRVKDVPRRHDYLDNRNGPYDGIFSGLGDHGDTKEVLGQQRRREYNERLDHAPHSKAAGRPTWVKETIANSTDRGKSPMRNPPPTDHYQQMLDEKRREEAQRRRHDDPEYQYQSNKMTPGSRDGGRYMGDMQQQRYGGYNQQE